MFTKIKKIKYVYKGYDCACIQTTDRDPHTNDEIKSYQDARYVSAPEAVWRLSEFEMHNATDTVIRLDIHLPDQRTITFRDNGDIDEPRDYTKFRDNGDIDEPRDYTKFRDNGDIDEPRDYTKFRDNGDIDEPRDYTKFRDNGDIDEPRDYTKFRDNGDIDEPRDYTKFRDNGDIDEPRDYTKFRDNGDIDEPRDYTKFRDNGDIDEPRDYTKLTKFFDLNRDHAEARQYLYTEIPYHYRWDKNEWKKRKRRVNEANIVSRIYSVSPRQRERFYLRLLLLHVRGPISFNDLKTYGDVVHDTFESGL